MLALTQIATPAIPHVKPDPNIARNSFRVIAAAEAEANTPSAATSSSSQGAAQRTHPAVIAAAALMPRDQKIATLFNGSLRIEQFADAGADW